MLILRPWESFADGAIWVRRTLEGDVYTNIVRGLDLTNKSCNWYAQYVDSSHGVFYLDRLESAKETLDALFPGEWREATPEELDELSGNSGELDSPASIVESLSAEELWRLGERLRKVAGPWEGDEPEWVRTVTGRGDVARVTVYSDGKYTVSGSIIPRMRDFLTLGEAKAAADDVLRGNGYELVEEE